MDTEASVIDLKKVKEYTKDMRVLYVEDDDIIKEEMTKFLERLFTVIDTASDGIEGLELYKKKDYDLIISDISMPHMNGIEMSKTILKKDPKQSIIICSAYTEVEYLLESVNSGIKNYILKPININQFTKVIYNIAIKQFEEKKLKLNNESIKEKNIELEKSLESQKEIINTQNYTNSLTGLDNIYAYNKNIKYTNDNQDKFNTLILLDIDNLEYINNLYGRDTGNQVIIDFSKLIKKFADDNVYEIYHISGDQFVLLEQVNYIDTYKYEIDIDALLTKIKEYSFKVDDNKNDININATIGISLGQTYPLEHADMALKYAKNNHKKYTVYNTLLDTTKEIEEKIKWRDRISNAIHNNNIVPVYHAIVDKHGKILKYESLMRLLEIDDGKEKLISPIHFLDIAIENKQYDLISSMMIYKVLDFLKTNKHTVSVNLTYSDISNKTFIKNIYQKVKEEDIGDRLIIEITENESIKDYDLLQITLEKFRSLGVRIAIDDFGSGYSNFNQILKIHPEYIKIDGTIIENIDIDSRSFILTKAITSFFHQLGIKVIAEYVHSEDIYDILTNFNVDEYQGYYFFKPQKDI